MRRVVMGSMWLCLFAALGAQAQTPAVQKQNLDKYLKYAGAPVDQFQFWKLYEWELVGPDKVVVWPNQREAYLLSVSQPCDRLQWAKAIGVTSTQHTVDRHFDSVTVDGQRCRIAQIQPIDYQRLKSDAMAPNHPDSQ